MFKGLLALLGVGLIALWIVTAGYGIHTWQMWTDGGLGIVSLICSIALPNQASVRLRVGVIGALALALLGSWIAGLVVSSVAWLDWTTLWFAAMYFLLAWGATGAGSGTAGGTGIESHRAA